MPGASHALRYGREPAVLWRSTLGGPVVLGPQHATPAVLGGAAALIWDALDEPMTAIELQAAVPSGEVWAVLAQLSGEGLVGPCP